jgi:hypothetical protein
LKVAVFLTNKTMNNFTIFTIQINMNLNEIKEAYRKYYGYSKKEKVTKQDLSSWLGALAQADVEATLY